MPKCNETNCSAIYSHKQYLTTYLHCEQVGPSKPAVWQHTFPHLSPSCCCCSQDYQQLHCQAGSPYPADHTVMGRGHQTHLCQQCSVEECRRCTEAQPPSNEQLPFYVGSVKTSRERDWYFCDNKTGPGQAKLKPISVLVTKDHCSLQHPPNN